MSQLRGETLPKMERRDIRAGFDSEGIFVYQAFCNAITDTALKLGTFGPGFGMRRFTWIKPSFGWMLYRSDFGTEHNQERILRIKLSHQGWLTLLRDAVPAQCDNKLFRSREEWQQAFRSAGVRYQWDPERDLRAEKIENLRAIQVGIGPRHTRQYVNDWILGIEDVTRFAHDLKRRRGEGVKHAGMDHPFPEQVYEVDDNLKKRLGMAQ